MLDGKELFYGVDVQYFMVLNFGSDLLVSQFWYLSGFMVCIFGQFKESIKNGKFLLIQVFDLFYIFLELVYVVEDVDLVVMEGMVNDN